MPKIKYTNKTTMKVSQSIGIADRRASMIIFNALIDVIVLRGLRILMKRNDLRLIDLPETM
jgi:hypothetical protein